MTLTPTTRRISLAALLLASACSHNPRSKATMQANPNPERYLVQFNDVSPRTDWNAAQQAVFQAHVDYLKDMERDGHLRYAGLARVPESSDLAFGFSIYAAADAQEAQAFVDADPGVAQGLLTADVQRLDRFFGTAP